MREGEFTLNPEDGGPPSHSGSAAYIDIDSQAGDIIGHFYANIITRKPMHIAPTLLSQASSAQNAAYGSGDQGGSSQQAPSAIPVQTEIDADGKICFWHDNQIIVTEPDDWVLEGGYYCVVVQGETYYDTGTPQQA